MKIWMRSYKPFTFGGNVNQNISTTIDKFNIIDLGKGFKGIIIKENNRDYVFELESGGLVGNSLIQVQDDINSCEDMNIIKEQIKKAIKDRDNTVNVTYQEFFK